MAQITISDADRQSLGETITHRLAREGDLDLRVTGWEIASDGTPTHDNTRGVRVTIYLTPSGRLVGHVLRWSMWDGEDDRGSAIVCEDAADLLEWLRDDRGYLGRYSRSAWEDACSVLPELAGADVEAVA